MPFAFDAELHPAERHDAGGKAKLKLPPGVESVASFSDCGRHRLVLERFWGDRSRFALWIGANPSIADSRLDDPTCQRERERTARLGMGAYVKCNVATLRCTDPRKLDGEAVHPENLSVIRSYAARAELVVVCFGSLLPRRLRHLGPEVVAALRADGRELWCLGVNADGSPKHPLYLPNHAELTPYIQPQ